MAEYNYLDWCTDNLVSGFFQPFTLTISQKELLPQVKRIIFHNPATIVFWTDGTKTVVKCMANEPYSEYYGFLCALGKKIYGSNSKITKLVKQYSEENKDA